MKNKTQIAIVILIASALAFIAYRDAEFQKTERGFMVHCIQDGGNNKECESAWAAEAEKNGQDKEN